jgi:hypothetical protein
MVKGRPGRDLGRAGKGSSQRPRAEMFLSELSGQLSRFA